MISKKIRAYGKDLTIACDGRCDKAWGINGRLKLYFMEEGEPPRPLTSYELPKDDDDHVFVGDNELGTASGPGRTAGLSEGGDLKPSAESLADGQRMNKWYLRECERSETFEAHEPIVIHDLVKPRPNKRKRA